MSAPRTHRCYRTASRGTAEVELHQRTYPLQAQNLQLAVLKRRPLTDQSQQPDPNRRTSQSLRDKRADPSVKTNWHENPPRLPASPRVRQASSSDRPQATHRMSHASASRSRSQRRILQQRYQSRSNPSLADSPYFVTPPPMRPAKCNRTR